MEAKDRELKQAEEFGMESEAIAQRKECRRCYDSFKNEISDERKAGIREVVEWIKIHSGLERCDPDVMAYFEDYRLFNEDEWQAKLKEWEMEDV